MTQTLIPIHEVVQQRYGSIAQGETSSCCIVSANTEGKCCDGDCRSLYDQALLEGVPEEAVNLSLGCGDPVTIASLRSGERVLDLGSGGGIDCFMAARQVGETGYVIGVDMTPAMLERANAAKARMGVTNVEFREGKIEALPVESKSIDVIMSNCVINLSPDKPAVLREAYRVLKPGGRLAISDIVTEGEFSPELRADAARWAECVTGAVEADEYIELLRAAGFREVTVVDKQDASEIVERTVGMPRLFSARITARK